MTARIEKTVFISYRHENFPWAQAIYLDLTHHDYDVFLDYKSIPSGDFEQAIIENIKSRAHFIVVLTPSAVERCSEPHDWLRREIEIAIDNKRNIIPLRLESFDFGSSATMKAFTGKLATLKKYQAPSISAEYFDEAMAKLRSDKFLNRPLESVLHPISDLARKVTEKQRATVIKASVITKDQLTAQEWVGKGYLYGEAKKFDEAIHCYDEAIRLHSGNMIAYHNRGLNRQHKGDLDGALRDFDEAIRLAPDFNEFYLSRGVARGENGDFLGAIEDFTQAIRLSPKSAEAYADRGSARKKLGDLEGALYDLNEAIRLMPHLPEAYLNRGVVRSAKGELLESIIDYDEAIRLKQNFWEAYLNRGKAYQNIGGLDNAIADFDTVINIKPDNIIARGNRGIAWRDKGDLDRAIADLNYVIQVKPDNDLAYYNRAVAWEMKNNYHFAIDDYRKYLELGGGIRIGDGEEIQKLISKLEKKL